MHWKEFEEKYGHPPFVYGKSDKEIKKTWPNHRKRWTKEEERKVLETARNLDEDNLNGSQMMTVISMKVGRTRGSLRNRFTRARLRMEYLFSLLNDGKVSSFLRQLAFSKGSYNLKNEMIRKLRKMDEIMDQNIKAERVSDVLNDNEDRWEIKYDPSNLLIDEEDE